MVLTPSSAVLESMAILNVLEPFIPPTYIWSVPTKENFSVLFNRTISLFTFPPLFVMVTFNVSVLLIVCLSKDKVNIGGLEILTGTIKFCVSPSFCLIENETGIMPALAFGKTLIGTVTMALDPLSIVPTLIGWSTLTSMPSIEL